MQWLASVPSHCDLAKIHFAFIIREKIRSTFKKYGSSFYASPHLLRVLNFLYMHLVWIGDKVVFLYMMLSLLYT